MSRALLAACLLLAASAAASPVNLAGHYALATGNGTWRFELSDDGGERYSGRLTSPQGTSSAIAGRYTVDEDGEVAIEGTVAGAAMSGEFAFYEQDEDGYALLLMPNDSDGRPRLDLAAEYPATRVAATPQDADPSDPAAATTRDSRLVGVWAAQVVLNTPNGNLATQTFMEFRADGYVIDRGSRAAGGIPGIGMESGFAAGGEAARWRSDGAMLYVSYAGSEWMPLARFEISGNRLLLTYYDGDRTLWYRQ